MSEFADILTDLKDHIQLMKEMGQRTVEISPEVWSAWTAPPRPARQVQAAVPAQVAAPPVQAAPRQPFRAPTQTVSSGKKVYTPEERVAGLAEIAKEIKACSECRLRENRTHEVPGQGNPHNPDVMFIGEAPGAEEDAQGLAFVGAAGQFLTKMITAMGYTRDQVFIANICKCRPPGNRTPAPDEMATCFPFLKRQIALIRPKTIVLLGGTAIKAILNTQVGVTRLQGQWSRYEDIPVMPTYHPSYVIRFERGGISTAAELKKVKRQIWDALKSVLAYLGKPVPTPKKK
ncbi:MAG: uracil-DNA glycosylase [Kiritimatiellae bacterium]|nr:uracil-DNA glycosylase [Kiritimatiellia bacterium]